MDTYEVAAIGDLYKKNTSGRKTWNLREFALTGVQMIYYKKGVKRGEWDISGCKLRKITAEEAQQPAAKYAFAIEGNKKQFMLSANNEKNRDLWMSVLEKQIHEFRNPVRRFIRTGEIVHANGFVKKGNIFGKVPILLVVTNYPRIIEIDPATIELRDQYSWGVKSPPTMTKLSETKFKINVAGKELKFEDPANGMVYWEALFQRISRIELWQPSKQPTLRIGFSSGGKASPRPESKKVVAEKSKDLQFLEEASAHIQELLNTLNTRIEEIDLIFATEVQYGDQQKSHDDSEMAAARQMKRSQLLMLKENIVVIADNLKSLIQRCKNTGSALFDVAAIESVISEAATLLVLLNSDEDDDDGDVDQNEEEEFIDEVNDIDNMVAAIESTINSKQSSDYEDSEPITELDLSPGVFDPKNPNKRPEGWTDVRMKRVLKREQLDRELGLDEDAIAANRATKLQEEEAAMLAEVAANGTVLGLKAGGRKRSASLSQDMAELDVNADNFDPSTLSKRPAFWVEVRTKRVMLKDHMDRINGMTESSISDSRPRKEVDEEMTMVGEVMCFGRLLNVAEAGKNPSTHPANVKIPSDFDSKKPRPAGWNAAKAGRVMLKELEDRLNGEDETTIKNRNAQKAKDEEEDMVEEAKENGFVTVIGKRIIHKKAESSEEAMDNAVKSASETSVTTALPPAPPASSHEIEEPVQYKDEVITFGNMSLEDQPPAVAAATRKLSAAPMPVAQVTRNRQGSVEISKQDIVKHTGENRPPGWAEIRLRRVLLKEWEDRKNGVDEDDILDKRFQRELEAEQEMIAELGVKGKIALFEKGIKSKVKKTGFNKDDVAAFMSSSSTAMQNMNDNINKLFTS